jgi:hypothetical protein
MKRLCSVMLFLAMWFVSVPTQAQQKSGSLASVDGSKSAGETHAAKHLFIDVHNLGAGKVTYEGVAAAHAKDLATEGQFDVEFIKYWVDTAKGNVYCLVSAYDSKSIIKSHTKANGLIPEQVYPVTAGTEAAAAGGKNLYLDFHELGAGKVKAADVAAAHLKDLAVQKKYGVNLLNYWVNEKDGVIMCLAEAPDSNALINTHKEAHGLLPKYVQEVKQGE